MVKHCIIWKLKEEENKRERAAEMKSALEGLTGKIDGLVAMKIVTEGLPSSSGDVMMESLFTDDAALAAYQKNPLHTAIADRLVRPFVQQRLSFDFRC